eukprot:TRINITY_DN17194_c0_g1_i1.p2 TRINITY_DN17194_c0_g1~~TRINITY_DN17194_c0_g1_i1.p2  ORF type:complete len:111 (+),score=48.10 TRINITY_DN17194_c0_g1_i1:66-398(+)
MDGAMSSKLIAVQRRLQPQQRKEYADDYLTDTPAWAKHFKAAKEEGVLRSYNRLQEDPQMLFPADEVDTFTPLWLRLLDRRAREARDEQERITENAAWIDALDAEINRIP